MFSLREISLTCERACQTSVTVFARFLARYGDTTMTSLKTVAAAVLLTAITATPVFAQAAIQEPGLFAFYHPNLDVLNGGAPTPAARLALEPPAVMQAYNARESGIGGQHLQRVYHRHVRAVE
jgi:hypothetical protein